MEEKIKSLEDKNEKIDSSLKALTEQVGNLSKAVIGALNILNKKIDILNVKVDGLDKRLASLEHSSSVEFENVGGKLDGIQSELEKINNVTNYTEQMANMSVLK